MKYVVLIINKKESIYPFVNISYFGIFNKPH